MIYELTIYELGKLLTDISEKYSMKLLVKRKLSGGFITVTGDAYIAYAPTEQKTLKGNNIIGIKLKNNENAEIDIKITGIKDSTFKIEISPTKFKEINIGGLSVDKIKESTDECKLRIDEDIIFTILASASQIQMFLLNKNTNN